MLNFNSSKKSLGLVSAPYFVNDFSRKCFLIIHSINERAFEVKEKTFFIIFKGLSVAKNCLRPESAPLS